MNIQGQKIRFRYAMTPLGEVTASYAIDGIKDRGNYSVWAPTAALPQSITIDLGVVRPDVGFFGYVPRHTANVGPSTTGAVTEYVLSLSSDNSTFTQVANGTWSANTAMKVVTFTPTDARYVRFSSVGDQWRRCGSHRTRGGRAAVGQK